MVICLAQAALPQLILPAPILLGIMLIFIGVCWARKRQEIGGWLLYFYGWMFLSFCNHLRVFLGNAEWYLPHPRTDRMLQLAGIVCAVPRLVAMLMVLVLMAISFKKRDKVWLQRLRLMTIITVVIAAISLTLDEAYFQKAVFANTRSFLMLIVWLSYLYVSQRVHQVFITKDWLVPAAKSQSGSITVSTP